MPKVLSIKTIILTTIKGVTKLCFQFDSLTKHVEVNSARMQDEDDLSPELLNEYVYHDAFPLPKCIKMSKLSSLGNQIMNGHHEKLPEIKVCWF